MFRMSKGILVLAVLVALSACSTKVPDLKSPCAGADGDPCGPKRNVNDWWS